MAELEPKKKVQLNFIADFSWFFNVCSKSTWFPKKEHLSCFGGPQKKQVVPCCSKYCKSKWIKKLQLVYPPSRCNNRRYAHMKYVSRFSLLRFFGDTMALLWTCFIGHFRSSMRSVAYVICCKYDIHILLHMFYYIIWIIYIYIMPCLNSTITVYSIHFIYIYIYISSATYTFVYIYICISNHSKVFLFNFGKDRNSKILLQWNESMTNLVMKLPATPPQKLRGATNHWTLMMELDPGGPPEVSFFMFFFTSFGEHSKVGVISGQKSFNKNTILGWELNTDRSFLISDTLISWIYPPTQDAIVANWRFRLGSLVA